MAKIDSPMAAGNYFNQILNHVKENVSKDIRYICMECGRLKNRDGELSGTLCPACESSNISLDPILNKFTTMVKNIQFDIENRVGDRNLFLKPAEPPVKQVLSSKLNLATTPQVKKSKDKPMNILITNTLGVQTDLSFNPFDNVSFVINKELDCPNQTTESLAPKKLDDGEIEASWKSSHSNSSQKQMTERLVQSESTHQSDSVRISSLHVNATESPHSLSEPNEIQNDGEVDRETSRLQTEQNDIQNIENVERILSKSQEHFVETETEMIESSVDDFLLPRKGNSSPLLFSQETKDVEMGEPSSGENSDTECVNATPPREYESTCTWRKDVSRCENANNVDEEKITSDKDDETLDHDNKELEKEQVHILKENENQQEEKDQNLDETNAKVFADEPMQTDDNPMDSTTIETVEDNHPEPSNETCAANEADEQNGDGKVEELTEQQRLTQNSHKFSKHNLKIVVSNIEGADYDHLERFIALFNPMIDNDVNQDSNFLIVGVDSENKVLRRTPKFLKAISLHVCIVNVDYLVHCVLAKDIVSLEKRFIPFDSSGLNGPIRSCTNPRTSLLGNFVFYSLEKDEYLSTLLEFIIIHNGGIIVPDIKLFKAYNRPSGKIGTLEKSENDRVDGGKVGALDETGPQYKKVLLYGENEEAQFTEAYKLKVFAAYSCHSLNYKCLFNCVASYDVAEMGL